MQVRLGGSQLLLLDHKVEHLADVLHISSCHLNELFTSPLSSGFAAGIVAPEDISSGYQFRRAWIGPDDQDGTWLPKAVLQ